MIREALMWIGAAMLGGLLARAGIIKACWWAQRSMRQQADRITAALAKDKAERDAAGPGR